MNYTGDEMDLKDIKKKVKKSMDKQRYDHTKGVMYTAGCLAMANEYPIDKAMLAGLLHDCAKCIPNNEKIDICRKHDILVSQVELDNPGLLHAKAGMVLAEEEYQITDPDILHSIKVHTTGEPGMNMLDKIIFVADYIEPGRNEAPRLEYLRKLAEKYRLLPSASSDAHKRTHAFMKGDYSLYLRMKNAMGWR